jgi:glycosyltransferase involved in cell wall biosynthesis
LRILLINQWFDPEPAIKGLAFAKGLTRLGHTVEVLTGFPNYPGGRVYEGYRVRPLQREQIDGISVVRVPLYPSHDRSRVGRVANYASFAFSAATIGIAAVRRPDVVHVYHPPATTGLAAIATRAFCGCPFVYDIQDLWPDTVATSGMMTSSWVNGALDRWCRYLYRSARRIVVVTPGFRDALCARGVPPEKIEIIYNWCSQENLCPPAPTGVSAASFGMADRFNVVFAGNMGTAQALDCVLEAARLTAGRLPKVQFVFVGGGIDVPRLRRRAVDMELENVRFLPPMPLNEIGRVLQFADALLVHLADKPLFRITIPSKIPAYMAAGRPILAAVRGDAADLVRRAGCGVVCEPDSPVDLAAAVGELTRLEGAGLHRLGLNGRAFYDRCLSLESGLQKFNRLLQAVGPAANVTRQ